MFGGHSSSGDSDDENESFVSFESSELEEVSADQEAAASMQRGHRRAESLALIPNDQILDSIRTTEAEGSNLNRPFESQRDVNYLQIAASEQQQQASNDESSTRPFSLLDTPCLSPVSQIRTYIIEIDRPSSVGDELQEQAAQMDINSLSQRTAFYSAHGSSQPLSQSMEIVRRVRDFEDGAVPINMRDRVSIHEGEAAENYEYSTATATEPSDGGEDEASKSRNQDDYLFVIDDDDDNNNDSNKSGKTQIEVNFLELQSKQRQM